MMNASFPDRRREHRTEPVPPEPHCFVADINAPLEQEILDLSQRKRITDVHHHREADYLRRTVEITEGILHPRRLRNATPRLKPICSDKAQTRHQHHGHHPADRSDEGIDAPFSPVPAGADVSGRPSRCHWAAGKRGRKPFPCVRRHCWSSRTHGNSVH